MATLGLTRIPFGFEVQEKDYIRLFLERSNMARAFFPGEYDLGAKLQGGWRWLRWQAAAMNGNPLGRQAVRAADPTASKDFLGRVGADALPRPRLHIVGGVSGLYGTGFSPRHAVDQGHAGVARQQRRRADRHHRDRRRGRGSRATPSRTFPALRRRRRSARRPSSCRGSGRSRSTARSSGPPTSIARSTSPIRSPPGATCASSAGTSRSCSSSARWCAVGVRYDRYDPDADASQQVGASLVPRDKTFSTLGVVAAAMWQPYGRLSFEWDHSWNALTVDITGRAATLGGDVLTLRGQVLF